MSLRWSRRRHTIGMAIGKGAPVAQDVKVTISLHRDVLRSVEVEGRRRGLSRSAMVEEALRSWQRMDEYRRLAQGYVEMREENRRDAAWWLPLVEEALDAEGIERRPSGGSLARRAHGKRK